MNSKLRFLAALCGYSTLFFLWPSAAHAYLDPGTGSMLVSALIGIAATAVFFVKNLYFKLSTLRFRLTGRGVPKSEGGIVFYSEGRQYWRTFKPVVEAMISQQQKVVYLTSDEADPGLSVDSEYLVGRYIGTGNRAFAALNLLEADICVLTTPGLDVLQITRSPMVKHYCHIVHAPTDLATYKLFSFDYFDSILCSGEHQKRSARYLEQLRGTKEKLLLDTGCCYLDVLAQEMNVFSAQSEGFLPASNIDHILSPATSPSRKLLLAPTWGANGMLGRFGLTLLLPLAKAGFSLCVRPHPQSRNHEQDLLASIQKELEPFPSVTWDTEASPIRAMQWADMIISDYSGIVFDYAFILERPVITLQFTPDLRGMEANDLPWPAWEFGIFPQIGATITPEQVGELPEIIDTLLADRQGFAATIRGLRDKSLYNYGRSGEVAAQQLLEIQRTLQHEVAQE